MDDDERPMTRREAISTIEALYPADSHEVGVELLERARREVNGWRNEPDAVLIRYARLCIDHERAEVARCERERRIRSLGY